MKKVLLLFLAVLLIILCAVQTFAATSTTEAYNKALAAHTAKFAEFSETLSRYDVDGKDGISPVDARITLRYSAGLETEGADTAKMDADGDGVVTSIDARYLLRISVGLESSSEFIPSQLKLDFFNALINLPKAAAERSSTNNNYYYVYANCIENIGNVTLKDTDGVIAALNNGMNKIATSEADKTDFAETLTSGFYANTSSYIKSMGSTVGLTGTPSYARARNLLPVILNSAGEDEYMGSYLTLDDIEKIEYKIDQTYKFTRYADTKDAATGKTVIGKDVLFTQSVTGLDSLTVYLKEDNSISGTHTSKAFVVEDEDDVMSEMEGVDNSFVADDFNEYGDFEFSSKTTLNSFKYHGAKITVYFYSATGNVVAICYDKSINYTVKLWMDIYIKLNALIGGLLDPSLLFSPLVDKAGNIHVTNNENIYQEFFFVKNVVQ